MNEITMFENKEFGTIRAFNINGQPYWVASEVAKALGYTDSSAARRRHCQGATKRPLLDKRGCEQDTYVIPESDVYRLIVHSKLPTAKRFEKWVFEEVLPTLRKQGTYSIQQKEGGEIEELRRDLVELKETVKGLATQLEQPHICSADPMPELSQRPCYDRRGEFMNYLLSTLCDMLNRPANKMLSIIYNKMQQDYGIDPNRVRQEYIKSHGGMEVSVFKAVCCDYHAAEAMSEIIVRSINYQLRPAYTVYENF